MDYDGLIITGTSAAGKTTLTRKLIETGMFEQVKAVTTREKRPDDKEEYEYVTGEYFEKLKKEDQLIISTQYRELFYGIKYSELTEVKKKNKIPILVITPASCSEYEKKIEKNFLFMSIFIDANDTDLNIRLQQRNQGATLGAQDYCRREKDREYKDDCLYYVKNIDLEKTLELIKTLWEYRSRGGILPKRIIQLMLECDMLLRDAMVVNIKGASYDLSLGDEYYYKGKILNLSENTPFLVIEPYDYVIATSTESANFPKDISGSFDLAVSLFCQGIVLSNGPCVDPGFRGRLFCLLFNTSNASIYLKRGQHYATLELQKLMEPTEMYVGKYQDKSHIVDYIPSNALQGGINELKKEVESLKRSSQLLQTAVSGGIAILLAVIAILLVIK